MMKKRIQKIKISLSRWAMGRKLPLFEGLSLYDVSFFFFKGIAEGRIPNRAASVAFSFFLALFPGLLFLFSLIPYFPIANLEEEVFYTFQRILPPDTYDAARSTIDDVLTNKRSDVLSFGALLALFFATNGVNAIITNFSHSYHQLESRIFWKQQIAAIILTIVLSILFLFGLTLIIFSSDVINAILEFFYLDRISPFLIETARFALMVLTVLMAITLLYNFGPSSEREWRFISPGSILATILIIASSAGFSFYVGNFGQYNKLYGSIGTLIVILLWIYINAMVLIIGFELNASIASVKNTNRQKELELDL